MTFAFTGLPLRAAAALLATFVGASAAFAQEEPAAEDTAPPAEAVDTVPVHDEEAAPADQDATELDTIQVTGSRLRRTDFETAQPVVVISREDIERTGKTDINEILRSLTVAGNNSAVPAQNRGFLSLGEVNLDLRNLGSNHTLLLVNGRRWVTGLVSTQPNVSDYNTIPTSIIERVEILKDGASAIYGSDAIGGVVNIITKRDYQGAELSVQYGQYFEQGDGENTQISLDWGRNWAGRSLFLNASFTELGRTLTKNRSATESPAPKAGKTRWSTNTERGRSVFFPTPANGARYQCPNLQGPVAAGVVADPVFSPILAGTAPIPAGLQLCTLHLIPGRPGGNPGDYRQTHPEEDKYNRFQLDSLTQPSERTSLFGQFTQNLGDFGDFTFEGLYNKRDSVGLSFNLAFAGGDLIDGSGRSGFSADHPLNPFDQNVGMDHTALGTGLGTGSGAWTMRLTDKRANLQFQQEVDTVRLGGTFRGDFEVLDHSFGWDAGYIWAENKIEEIVPLPRYDRVQLSVGNVAVEAPDGTIVGYTYDPDVCQAPCVPVNPFNGQAGFDYDAVSYAYYDTWQRNKNKQEITFVDFNSEIPQFVDWQAGPIAIAFGAEVRRDAYFSKIDPIIQQGGLVLINQQQDSGGRNKSEEAYLEFGIPLLKDLPGASSLDLDIAGRYSRYPGFGSITTGKAGLRWQPLEDLLVRGTYSTGFRAPSIAEMFLTPAQSGDNMIDPCTEATKTQQTQANCIEDGAVAANGEVANPYALWQGDRNLNPEESTNITYGLVYSPRFIPDLNLSVDFYDITIDQFITVGGGLAQFFLDSCYKQADRQHCDKIHRVEPSGELDWVDVPFFNLGKIETEGVDFDVDYLLPLPDQFGRFKLRLSTSYLTRYEVFTPRFGQEDLVESAVGQTSGFFSGWPRWKAGSELSWSRELWSASWSTRMAYKMTEPCQDSYGLIDPNVSYSALGLCSDPKFDEDGNDVSTNELKTVFYHDVQVGREFPGVNADVSFGIRNALDQDPPQSYSEMGSGLWFNYDPTHYETPGRFGYVRIGYKF